MRTKLLHVTTIPQSLSFLVGQPRYMQSRGFECIALSSDGDLLQGFAASEGVSVFAVDMTRRITPLRDLLALFRVWRVLRRVQPEIVQSQTPKGGLLGMIAARLAGVPVRIYQIHGLPLMTASGFKRTILRCTERISCLLSHRVLCVSDSLREVVVAERICPAGKVKVLARGSCNGVDAAGQFNPQRVGRETRRLVRLRCGIPRDALVVGFVGRIGRDKGMLELAEAWRSLRDGFGSLHLLLVGQFEHRDPVAPDVQRAFREDERIHLVGRVADTQSYYAAMDLLAFPTHREGFGRASIEAGAMKLPVVTTRIPGCVDAMEDGVAGTLVPVRDARSLADAVGKYLEDPELRRKHGEAGRRRALRDFRPQIVWKALHHEYLELLQEKGLPLPQGDGITEVREATPRAA